MSAMNYFDGLISRAMEEAAVLEPRRASRYEPAASGVGEARIEESEEVVVRAPAVDQELAPGPGIPTALAAERAANNEGRVEAPRLSAREAPVEAAREHRSGAASTVEPVVRPAVEAPSQELPRINEPRRVETVRVERVVPSARVEPESRVEPPRAVEPGRMDGAIVPQEPVHPRVPMEGVESLERRVEALERRREELPKKAPAAPEREPAAAADQERSPRERPRPEPRFVPVVRAAPSTLLAAETKAAAPPEPIVQVTIGRIEVRATTAGRSARTHRPAAPRLSLDEYLRKREGG